MTHAEAGGLKIDVGAEVATRWLSLRSVMERTESTESLEVRFRKIVGDSGTISPFRNLQPKEAADEGKWEDGRRDGSDAFIREE